VNRTRRVPAGVFVSLASAVEGRPTGGLISGTRGRLCSTIAGRCTPDRTDRGTDGCAAGAGVDVIQGAYSERAPAEVKRHITVIERAGDMVVAETPHAAETVDAITVERALRRPFPCRS